MKARGYFSRLRSRCIVLDGGDIMKLIAIGYVAGLLVGFLARGYI